MADERTMNKAAAGDVESAEHTRCVACYRPSVDIVERNDELVVFADMPGATSETIDVKFEDGTLTIHAKVEPRQDESVEYLVREYGVGDYYRTFHVSEAIDSTKITADYSDGVLRLCLPKAEAARPRKIAVKSA